MNYLFKFFQAKSCTRTVIMISCVKKAVEKLVFKFKLIFVIFIFLIKKSYYRTAEETRGK